MVEAPGVEPGSENASGRASTCVSVDLVFRAGRATASYQRDELTFVSPTSPWAYSSASLIGSALPSSRRKPRALSLPGFYSGSEGNSVIVRSCRIAPFYVAWGATTRSSNVIIPVETVSPPIFKEPRERSVASAGTTALWGCARQDARRVGGHGFTQLGAGASDVWRCSGGSGVILPGHQAGKPVSLPCCPGSDIRCPVSGRPIGLAVRVLNGRKGNDGSFVARLRCRRCGARSGRLTSQSRRVGTRTSARVRVRVRVRVARGEDRTVKTASFWDQLFSQKLMPSCNIIGFGSSSA
jgi:hypothetical protein